MLVISYFYKETVVHRMKVSASLVGPVKRSLGPVHTHAHTHPVTHNNNRPML